MGSESHSFGVFISFWISHVLPALAEENIRGHVVSTCFHHISIRLLSTCLWIPWLDPLVSVFRFGASGPLLHCVWSVDDASLELDAQSIALYTLSHAMPTALLSTATIPFPGPICWDAGMAWFHVESYRLINYVTLGVPNSIQRFG